VVQVVAVVIVVIIAANGFETATVGPIGDIMLPIVAIVIIVCNVAMVL